jgi:hypothetical protein
MSQVPQGGTGSVAVTGISSGSQSGWAIYDPSNNLIAQHADFGAYNNGWSVDSFVGSSSGSADVTAPGAAPIATGYKLSISTTGFYEGFFDVVAGSSGSVGRTGRMIAALLLEN